MLALGLLLSGCPRPGLAPEETTTTATTTTGTMECEPDAKEPCYSGEAGTEGVGACQSGERLCNPTGAWGACDGEVLPTAESCVPEGQAPVDLDCDGTLPAACAEPVVFVTVSKPGIDAGSSVAILTDGRVLWAGAQSLSAGNLDAFVQVLGPDGAPMWRYEDMKGPGFQQAFQAVESGASLFAAGTAVPAGGGATDGFTVRLSKAGLEEKVSSVASPGGDQMTLVAPAGGVKGGVFAAGTLGGTAMVPEGGGASFGDADDLFVMRIQQDGFVPWNMVCAGAAPASIPRALVRDAAHARLYFGLIVVGSIVVPRTDGALELKPLNGDPSDAAVYVIDENAAAAAPVTDQLVFRSSGADSIEAIAADTDGTFYVAGTYAGDELKLNGKAILSGNPDGQREAFVARVDPAGNVTWAQRFGGAKNQRAHALAFAGGSPYFAGTLDGPGALGQTAVPHAAGVDLVVAKLDRATGEVVSLRVSDGKGDEWPAALAVDETGGVWVTGDFSADLSFAGKQATANGDFDAFLFRLPP